MSVEHICGGYSEEEAEWDGFFGVVWVAKFFEEVLMFVCGLCREICLNVAGGGYSLILTL